jgi:hypothetical protein
MREHILHALQEPDLLGPAWGRLVELCGGACVRCRRSVMDRNGKIDKRVVTRALIIPPSAGGTKTAFNVQPLCRACASTKSDRRDYRPAGVLEQLHREFPWCLLLR